MVTSVTSLTGNGLKDWLLQRISAVYLAGYVIFLVSFICCHHPLTYADWSALFHMHSVKILSVLAFLMLIVHSWIGIWTVTTDYIQCTILRLTIQVLVALFLGAQLIWGFMIVWG